MELNFDINKTYLLPKDQKDKKKRKESLISKVLTRCNTKWFKTSWLGILVYISFSCINYLIGYYGWRHLGFGNLKEFGPARIFGDLVTVGWFAVGFVSLPWHNWEEQTWVKTRDWRGAGRFLAWWLGTVITLYVLGVLGEDPLFQSSLGNFDNLTADQQAVYYVVFSVIGGIVVYWFAKLCPCGKKPTEKTNATMCKRLCNPPTSRSVVFVRIILIITGLFVISYMLCNGDTKTDCSNWHIHHWWFGFCLTLISTTTLDNWFDYFLQGVFWTFITESIFHYPFLFGEFFLPNSLQGIK